MTPILQADPYLTIADGLSPAPRILPRLLVMLADTDSDISQIVDLISFDPGLTSKLLRAANSAFVGISEPVSDVSEAVNQLGVAFVYQLAAAVCGRATYRSSCRDDLVSMLWQHSVTSAFAAEMMAADLRLDQANLFTAALLHDLGKLVMAERWKENYWQLLEETQATPALLTQREQEAFQLNHGEVGGRVLAHWKFPIPIASSVWQHSTLTQGIPFEQETACVALAEGIADAILGNGTAAESGHETALAVLGLQSKDLKPYVSRTQENFQFVNAMCQVGL